MIAGEIEIDEEVVEEAREKLRENLRVSVDDDDEESDVDPKVDRMETDDGDTDTLTHVCPDCAYETELDTPQLRAKAYCQGECDTLKRFVRTDKVGDDE